MVAELRYLGNFFLVFLAIVAIFGTALVIGASAGLGPAPTTIVFFMIGGCASVAYMAFLMRRHVSHPPAQAAVAARPVARVRPILIEALMIVCVGFSTV